MENKNFLTLYQSYLQPVEETVGYEGLMDVVKSAGYKIDLLTAKGLGLISNLFNNSTIALANITKYKTKQPNIKQLYKENKKLGELIRDGKINVTRAFSRYVPVVMGLKADLPTVVDFLLKHSTDVAEIYKLLNDFSYTIDSLLTAKVDDFKRVLPTKAEIEDIAKRTNAIKKDFSKLFDTKLMTDRKKVKELVKNPKQLTDVISKAIKLGEVYRKEETDKLSKLYREVSYKLETLISVMEKNTDLPKDVRDRLAGYVLALAEYLTSVSFVIYLHVSLVDMLNAIVKIIKLDANESKNVLNKVSERMKNLFKQIGG